MAMLGFLGLFVALAMVVATIVCLVVSLIQRRAWASPARPGISSRGKGDAAAFAGSIAALASAVALTFCCALLVYGFMTGNLSLEYLVEYRSDATGPSAWLFKLAGLWGGREGSLLFWAWLISVFGALVAHRVSRRSEGLDVAALLIIALVLAAFVGVLFFSDDNYPFTALAAQYIAADGSLTGAAAAWGMNSLLEHWAMAIHPPTLFIGYAGLTVPFAYAIAALITGDASDRWVRSSQTFALVSWFFLGAGIGLGAVWAYVVLGWGGYWGWDPVENASLLPWLVGLALIHSFTLYRQRGSFKRWSVFCACLTFTFVILGTFITRSGLVQSVHAFEGDPVSLVLFLALIIASLVLGILGLALRWKRFASIGAGDEISSLASRDAAYYMNNLILILFALIIAYMTISAALPSWMLFGGTTVSAGTYEAIARPLGIIYCALMAVCPMLSWGKTEGKAFWKRAKVPGIAAIVLFALLVVLFVTKLWPAYIAGVAEGGSIAAAFTDYGPAWYYALISLAGFLVASLLFMNMLMTLAKVFRSADRKPKGEAKAASGFFRRRASTIGGMIAHLAMAVILVGLIGSDMYVTERVGYLAYDEATDTIAESVVVGDYELEFTGSSGEIQENGTDILYTVNFDVAKGGSPIGTVSPTVELNTLTMQQKLNAAVISFPLEDLFVVFQGFSNDGLLVLDVRVNPLIGFVWFGFGLLMVGILIAAFARRGEPKPKAAKGAAEELAAAKGAAEELAAGESAAVEDAAKAVDAAVESSASAGDGGAA